MRISNKQDIIWVIQYTHLKLYSDRMIWSCQLSVAGRRFLCVNPFSRQFEVTQNSHEIMGRVRFILIFGSLLSRRGSFGMRLRH